MDLTARCLEHLPSAIKDIAGVDVPGGSCVAAMSAAWPCHLNSWTANDGHRLALDQFVSSLRDHCRSPLYVMGFALFHFNYFSYDHFDLQC